VRAENLKGVFVKMKQTAKTKANIDKKIELETAKAVVNKAKYNPQGKNWTLTINNPSITMNEQSEYFKKIGCDYFAFQTEVASTGTEHYQCYVHFDKRKRFSELKKLFTKAHIEPMISTATANRNYCTKDDTRKKGTDFIEFGKLIEERERTDLAELYTDIKNGLNNMQIAEKSASNVFRYKKSIDELREELAQEKYKNCWRDLEVVYISGQTGTGKTRYVMEKFGYENVYRASNYPSSDYSTIQTFDTYNGQNILLLEEFRSSLKFELLLNVLDGYPLQLPARYHTKTACFTKVYICSNITLNEQYPYLQTGSDGQKASYDAFKRRIHKIIDLNKWGTVENFERCLQPLSENEQIKIEEVFAEDKKLRNCVTNKGGMYNV